MQQLKVTDKRIILFILMVITIGKVNVYATEIIGSKSKSDSTIIEYLKEYGIHTTTNNEVKILKSGHEKFIDLFKDIKKAKHHKRLYRQCTIRPSSKESRRRCRN